MFAASCFGLDSGSIGDFACFGFRGLGFRVPGIPQTLSPKSGARTSNSVSESGGKCLGDRRKSQVLEGPTSFEQGFGLCDTILLLRNTKNSTENSLDRYITPHV